MPDFSKRFIITSDASILGIASVLEQEINGSRHPIAFASRSLSPAEKNYSITELEALSAVWAITKQFRYYVFGRKFDLVTDHASLRYLLTKASQNASGRLVRWGLKLSEFQFTIIHRSGKSLGPADFLSRNIPSLSNIIREHSIESASPEQMRIEQEKDETFAPILAYLKGKISIVKIKNTALDHFYMSDEGVLYYIDQTKSSYRKNENPERLCLPFKYRRHALKQSHDNVTSGHFGIYTSWDRLKKYYYWPNQYADVKHYVSSCSSCQQRNIHPSATKSDFQPLEKISGRCQVVELDVIGPWSTTESGNSYILVIIDKFTKWVEAIPIKNQLAHTVASAFVHEFISRHGVPSKIVSDQGSTFMSKTFQEMAKYLEIEALHGVSYIHRATGTVERVNQTIERTLSHFAVKNLHQWDEFLPMCLFALRTAKHSSTNETPFFLTYLRDPQLPYAKFLKPIEQHYYHDEHYIQRLTLEAQLAFHLVQENLEKASESRLATRSKISKNLDFQEGDIVYRRHYPTKKGRIKKLEPYYSGPYRLVERLSPTNVKLVLVYHPKSKPVIAHRDQLKTGYLREPYPSLQDIQSDDTQESQTSLDSTQHLPQDDNPDTTKTIPDNNQDFGLFDVSNQEEINEPTLKNPPLMEKPVKQPLQISEPRLLRSQGNAQEVPYMFNKKLHSTTTSTAPEHNNEKSQDTFLDKLDQFLSE